MKKYFFMAVITTSLLLQIQAQEKRSAAQAFLETRDKSGLAAALSWLDGFDAEKARQYLCDEKEFLNIGKEMKSFGDVEEAARFFESAAKLIPPSSAIWENLGAIYVRLLRKDEAVRCFQQAIAVDPKNRGAQQQLKMIDILLEDTRHETREKMKSRPGQNTGLQGPYLGQRPPGLKPELFAPGIVSVFGSNENTVTLSPDGRELYFGKESGIWVCRWTDEGWTAPQNAGWPGYEMWISPDTGKMYYTGYEPGIWFMERSGAGWGKPQKLVSNGMFSTLTRDETLYTTVFSEKGKANVGRYVKKDGKYETPEVLGPEINSPNGFDAHPNVAPDGSFLLFDRQLPEGNRLFISFKSPDGGWSPARLLGDDFKGSLSTFSPDGKYLFFMKNRDIYWVSAKIIEELRPNESDKPAAGAAQSQEIFDAVKIGDVTKLKRLLEKDASSISLKDASGNSLLHIAAAAGSLPITGLLLSAGADINATNTELNTPLHTAVQNGRDEVSGFLIKSGADLNKHNANGYTPLHSAALQNRRAIAEALISKGADIESQSNQNYTPLGLIARSTESNEVAELLIQKGANINARDAAGRMPLNNAVLYSSDRIIDLLLDCRAEISQEPRFLRLMLSSAAQRGHLRSFQFIVEKGGEELFKDDSYNPILMRQAISGGSLEIVKMLQARNVSLDVSADVEGLTPLHDAAGNPRALATIGFLIQNGADVKARTNDGRSAYNIAEDRGNKEAMSLILKHGGSPEPQKFPSLTGPYMGQAPPGNEPEGFAPGIVSPSHCTITVSPDGKEMYWATGTRIMGSRIQDGRWTRPTVVAFSGQSSLSLFDDVPFLAPDNRRMYFTSRRPLGSSSENKENIWYVERTPSGWSDPRPVSAAVNAMQLHWQVSVSRSGALYFGGTGKDSYGLSDIYCSKLINGEYTKPVNLGPVINSNNGETMPCIAPDESFLIFYKVVLQRPSLYISFRAKDGQWLPPKMFERLSARVGAILSLDGRYLFIDNRWVSAKIIEELRPKE